MDENETRRRRHRLTALTLGALFVAYFFSSGPAVTALGATNSHPALLLAFKVVYGPLALILALLPKQCDDAASRWLMWWDFYGVF